MRTPRSISPSALARFEKDRDDYYFTYLCDVRTEREPQSPPASVGSAFDAYVKSQLMSDIFGETTFEELFESQVEEHNRDFARDAGAHVMENYIACGAYKDLLDLMEDAEEEPQFEFDADTVICGVPISGKPDCRFKHKDGAHVVLDWKVNGYCSKSATSPSKGYAMCRDGSGWPKPSRSHEKSHSLYKPREFMGLTINEFFMEHVSVDWADQLSLYAWMMGEPVGSDRMVVCIEQIVSKPQKGGLEEGPPLLRIANHKCQVSPEHQHLLEKRLITMWEAVQSGHVFTDLSEDDNDDKCQELDKRARSMISDGTEEGDFFAKCARPAKFYRTR